MTEDYLPLTLGDGSVAVGSLADGPMRWRLKSDIDKCVERIVDGAIVAPQTGHRAGEEHRGEAEEARVMSGARDRR